MNTAEDSRRRGSVAASSSAPPCATPSEVRTIRTTLGKTQREFGALLGVGEFTVWRWEADKRPVTEAHTRLMRNIYMRHLNQPR